jgi:hypothetical protein
MSRAQLPMEFTSSPKAGQPRHTVTHIPRSNPTGPCKHNSALVRIPVLVARDPRSMQPETAARRAGDCHVVHRVWSINDPSARYTTKDEQRKLPGSRNQTVSVVSGTQRVGGW